MREFPRVGNTAVTCLLKKKEKKSFQTLPENIVFDYLTKHLAPKQLSSRYLIQRMISAHIFSNGVFGVFVICRSRQRQEQKTGKKENPK